MLRSETYAAALLFPGHARFSRDSSRGDVYVNRGSARKSLDGNRAGSSRWN